MKAAPEPIARDLVLVGGGHSHVIVLRMLGMNPVPGLRVTLVSPDVRTPYSGMLPGVVAGHYTADDIHIELGALCRFAGARFIRAAATGIDLGKRTLSCEGRAPLSWDVLSLDVGITPAVDQVEGADRYAIAVKPIHRFLTKFEHFLERARTGAVQRVGVVGAGAGGVELCLAIDHRLRKEGITGIGMHLFSDTTTVLPGYPDAVRSRFRDALLAKGIELHLAFQVAHVVDGAVVSDHDQSCPLDEIFFVTQAASQSWLQETGLDLDVNGFIKVRDTLQTVTDPDVFAAGDIIFNVDHPRPRAGVFAVRQGKPLHDNLRRRLLGRKTRPFRPQKEFLSLITTGERSAVASKWQRSAQGRWVWHWKDWIDRRFMNRFNALPEMTPPRRKGLLADFDDQMQCGGCGAKVSADLLREVLAEMGLSGVAADDAAVLDVPAGKSLLQTVDVLRSFIEDPDVFARICVNHALSDIHAMGGKPVTALAMITLPFASPGRTKALLQQLMHGAMAQLRTEGVDLVGGHTSEGMELSLGFTVNGIVDRGRPTLKSGLQPGDALILTKPLGTGVLFAADMQMKARGAWIEAAVESMLASNGPAAEVLVNAGVRAMTDVTGFGLAGHLMEMLQASGVAAQLDLSALPALDGSLELLNRGIRSTLHAGNERSVDDVEAATDSRRALLFDPQTAGGLVAGVDPDRADEVVSALRHHGYPYAAHIGQIADASPFISFADIPVVPSVAEGPP